MMDRTYGVSTSELRGENRNFELEQKERESKKTFKSSENFIKLNSLVLKVILHSIELKNNPLSNRNELKPLIARSILTSNSLEKNKKLDLLFKFEIDPASIKTQELIKIKFGDKSVYKVYLAASVFSKFADNELNYMSQVKEIKNIVNLELKQSLEKGFAGKDLDTKTLVYLAREGLLK